MMAGRFRGAGRGSGGWARSGQGRLAEAREDGSGGGRGRRRPPKLRRTLVPAAGRRLATRRRRVGCSTARRL